MRSTRFISCALAAWLAVFCAAPAVHAQQPLFEPPPTPGAAPGASKSGLAGPASVGGSISAAAPIPAGPAGPTKVAAGPHGRAAQPRAVQQASYAQPLAADPAFTGETVYYEGGPLLGGEMACGPGGCTHCGRFGCGGGGPLGRGCLGGLFVRAEYLGWGTKGMNLPPLVTTSPEDTDRFDAGVLGEDGTVILFGGESVGGDMRSGGRITFGRWFDPCQRLGVEADYFALADESGSFVATSDGEPILARPFFDVLLGVESAELIAFPDVIQGTVAADYRVSFQGAGVRAVYNLCCGDGCGTSCVTGCTVPTGYRFNLITGYRFLRLDDRVGIVEDLTVSDSTVGSGAFFIRDQFQTENQFHGWDLGTSLNLCKGCWSLDLLSKVAIGNTRSEVNIDGSSVITQQGTSEIFQGGLLAQRTNIGTYILDEFAMVPELGATIGYQVNPCWRVTFGYSFIYWSRVLRAGDAISRELNPDLLPPEEEDVDSHLQPRFVPCYDHFWAQGLNVGLEGKW